MKIEIGPCTLYRGDCLELIGELQDASAVISDPPYGMNWNADSTRFTGGKSEEGRGRGIKWHNIQVDNEPFDPTPWLDFQHVVLFGSNHFGQRLPVGTKLIWIKKYDTSFGTFLSDAEEAWMKGGNGIYCKRDCSMNGAGANFQKLHPTQKPVGIMAWVMDRAKIPQGATVLDPYMGSGTTGIACVRTGRKFIGIEKDPTHFSNAVERIKSELQQEVFAM